MLRTALAMVPGTLSISGYNLVDGYFVGKLGGAAPLAAIGLTFPLVMICGCVFHGLSAGVMTTTAQSLGGKRRWRAAQLVSSGMLLISIFSILLSIVGMLGAGTVFRWMHASPEAAPLATEYMNIWYLCCLTSALGMAGNNLLVTANDSKLASATMVLGLLSNAALDPIFMFGWLGMPAMGFKGAAWATVAAQLIGTTAVLLILWKKHHLIRFTKIPILKLLMLWKRIVSFAIPATLGMLMLPIGIFIMTWITTQFGDVVLGAISSSGKIQTIAFIFPMSLGMSLLPMIGQNYGAKLYSRIHQCRRFAVRFAFGFMMTMSLLYCVFAHWLVIPFTPEPDVRVVMAHSLRIIPWGFAFIETHRYCGFFCTGCGRPATAAWLNALRVLGLLAPLSLLVLLFYKQTGLFDVSVTMLFFAQLTSDVLAGVIAMIVVKRMTSRFPADGESENLRRA